MKFLQIISISLSIVLLISCKNDNITTSGGNVIRIINPTVLHTDEFGNIIGGDTTDWCSNNSTLFRFLPAYPNPTDNNVKLVFQLPESDTISIMYLKSNGDTASYITDIVLNPGFYNTEVSASSLNIHGSVTRFIIRSKRFPAGADFCRYYGDVQFY